MLIDYPTMDIPSKNLRIVFSFYECMDDLHNTLPRYVAHKAGDPNATHLQGSFHVLQYGGQPLLKPNIFTAICPQLSDFLHGIKLP